MTSLAKTYWQIFLAQGICEGIGMGIMYMPAVTGRFYPVLSFLSEVFLEALNTMKSGSGVKKARSRIHRLTGFLPVVGTYFARKRTMGKYVLILAFLSLVDLLELEITMLPTCILDMIFF